MRSRRKKYSNDAEIAAHAYDTNPTRFTRDQNRRHTMKNIFILLVLSASLAACSYSPLFRVPVLQGNVVTAEKVKQLEIGMTPRQVQFLLGTPLLENKFGEDRWDYVYYYRDPRGVERESQLSLFFREQTLARIEGDETYEALLPENEKEIDPGDVNG